MSVSISGELVFKVTFDQHGFPASMYTRAAIIHTCAGVEGLYIPEAPMLQIQLPEP